MLSTTSPSVPSPSTSRQQSPLLVLPRTPSHEDPSLTRSDKSSPGASPSSASPPLSLPTRQTGASSAGGYTGPSSSVQQFVLQGGIGTTNIPTTAPFTNLSSSPADLSSGGGSSSYRIPASASSYPIVYQPSGTATNSTNMPPNLQPQQQLSPPQPPLSSYHAAYNPSYMMGRGGAILEQPQGPPQQPQQGVPQPQQGAQSSSYGATLPHSLLPPTSSSAAASANMMMAPTPWTLGSTNGELALQLALLRQQEAGGVTINPASSPPPPPGGESVASSSSPAVPTSSNQRPQQGQQGGASASASGGGSVDGTYSNASSSQQQQQQYRQLGGYTATTYTATTDHVSILRQKQSLYQDRLIQQASASVESVLAASCEVMGFDIAELWLRTGPKTHQLTNSHLRPTALEDSVRQDLVDVYYGEKSSERTHRLSPALCKRAKEAGDVVWVSAHTQQGADALRCSISNVRTAVAIPICHEASNTNITIIFFSIRRIIVRPTSVEFLVHMALAAGVASVNSLSEDGLLDRDRAVLLLGASSGSGSGLLHNHSNSGPLGPSLEQRQQLRALHPNHHSLSQSEHAGGALSTNLRLHQPRLDRYSVTGAHLDLQWRQLRNVEYLTDGGNSWIHTAVYNGRPVVVKTLKPECQDVALAINEIEGELSVHARLHHPNIVELLGAGTTSKGVRFVVLERLDGGTLTQRLGYDTRIRDRRRRFWRKKHFSYLDVLRIARSIAQAMAYCHEEAIPGCVVLHRDLKPDNIGFTLDGTVKILDFGLAKIVENASVNSDEQFAMSGETGSLRYMAPEVADALPYNHCADVYSFGVILWELNAGKKPFDGLNRELFYERVVHGGERPPLHRKWPRELTSLMSECWDADMHNRPKFRDIVQRLDRMLNHEKGGTDTKKKPLLPKLSGMIDRHSTWF